MYEYKVVKIIKVIDGDTVDVEISLGYGVCAKFRFRLAGIDTPEIYGAQASEEGQAAKAFVERWFEDRSDCYITVRTYKGSNATVGIGDGAFGRWMGSFIAYKEGSSAVFDDLSLDLINEGYVK